MALHLAFCRSNTEDTARSRLRSAAHGDLQVPRSKTGNFGKHAFAVAGPASWNKLPATIRSRDNSAKFQEPIESSILLTDHFFFFSIHLERGRP